VSVATVRPTRWPFASTLTTATPLGWRRSTWRNVSGETTGGLYGGTSARHGAGRLGAMCRNIKTLHNFDPPATEDEVRAAALQYVRKLSGSAKPSKANETAFERAVDEVAATSLRLLAELVTTAPPKSRELEAARARARAEKRFGAAA